MGKKRKSKLSEYMAGIQKRKKRRKLDTPVEGGLQETCGIEGTLKNVVGDGLQYCKVEDDEESSIPDVVDQLPDDDRCSKETKPKRKIKRKRGLRLKLNRSKKGRWVNSGKSRNNKCPEKKTDVAMEVIPCYESIGVPATVKEEPICDSATETTEIEKKEVDMDTSCPEKDKKKIDVSDTASHDFTAVPIMQFQLPSYLFELQPSHIPTPMIWTYPVALQMANNANLSQQSSPDENNSIPSYVPDTNSGNLDESFRDLDATEIYKRQCVADLTDPNKARLLVDILDEHDCLSDFMNMTDGLATETFPAKNISFLCALETAKIYTCKNTTGMRYRSETHKLWEMVRCVGGGKVIRLFQGNKHLGQITCGLSKRGTFRGQDADFNFAVPAENTLRNTVTDIPSRLKPGFLSCCICHLDKSKQYVLTVDGKKCFPERGENLGDGDANLFGFEQPKLSYLQRQFDEEINIVQDLYEQYPEDSQDIGNLAELGTIANILSRRIRRQRMLQVDQERLRRQYQRNIDSGKFPAARYKHAFENMSAFTQESNNLIDNLLSLNGNICNLMAKCNGNGRHYKSGDNISMDQVFNFMTLLPTNNENEVPELVKQRSPLWFKFREKARVTGSSLHNALTLRLVRDQRLHHDTYIMKKPRQPFPASVQRKIDHGIENEINGVATVCTTILPALMPSCFKFFETGCHFLNGDKIRNLLEVSPDGLIGCDNVDEHDCHTITNLPANQCVIEIKCPLPDDADNLLPVHYKVPWTYAIQVLSEMKSAGVNRCWFISYTKASTVLIWIDYDDFVWSKIWSLTKDLYDVDNVKRLRTRPYSAVALIPILKRYVDEESKFIMEVPSVKSATELDIESCQPDPHTYGYALPLNQEPNEPNISPTDIVNDLRRICEWADFYIRQCFELERPKPKEVMMFVLSDVDRSYDTKALNTVPIAYGLRGDKLSVHTMRNMMSAVRDELVRNGIEILCESFDGQWLNLATRTDDNQPLTMLQVQKDVWRKCKSLNKKKAFALLMQNTKAMEDVSSRYWSDKDRVLSWFPFPEIGTPRWLSIPGNRPELLSDTAIWPLYDDDENDLTCSNNICELLQKGQYHPSARKRNYSSLENSELVDVLCTHHKQFLTSVLLGLLANKGAKKWQHYDIVNFAQDILTSVTKITRMFTSYELDIVCAEIMKRTSVNIFSKRCLKAMKQAVLFKILRLECNGNERIPLPRRPRRRQNSSRHDDTRTLPILHVDSLVNLCSKQVYKSLPKNLCVYFATQITYATEIHKMRMSAPAPGHVALPVPPYRHDVYCTPECSDASGMPKFKLSDASHIMVNLRTHFTSKRVFGCDPQAFIQAAYKIPETLHPSVIKYNLDKQNVSIAENLFSQSVEACMRSNGNSHEADCVRLVRNWYNACNERGLSVKTRLEYWLEMYNFLFTQHNFFDFPTAGQTIRGLPIVVFEGILINISVRIQIYRYATGHAVNNRSLGTLSHESSYADVAMQCTNSNGVPGSYEFEMLLAKMIRLQQLKLDPSKNFTARTTKRTVYPDNPLHLQNCKEYATSDPDTLFRDHYFDVSIPQRKWKRRKRSNISVDKRTVHGAQSIRNLGGFKINEENIPAADRTLSLLK